MNSFDKPSSRVKRSRENSSHREPPSTPLKLMVVVLFVFPFPRLSRGIFHDRGHNGNAFTRKALQPSLSQSPVWSIPEAKSVSKPCVLLTDNDIPEEELCPKLTKVKVSCYVWQKSRLNSISFLISLKA